MALGPRILVVEDDAIIGVDLADQLTELGCDVVGVIASVREAIEAIDTIGCDIAVLDVNLGDETAAPIAAKLTLLQIPFVTLTGYASDQCPPELRTSGPVLFKPVRIEQLWAVVQERLAHHQERGTEPSRPQSLG